MLRFEKWILDQDVSEYAKMLFIEAIECYKIEAYRSSFITSYLGLLIAVKDRILDNRNNKSAYISDVYWNRICEELQKEDKWESEIFDIIRKEQDSIFLLDSSTRDAMLHWRHERNLTAHGRKKEVANSQVEYFWDFIEKNLSKFYVGGGKETVINEIYKNFDITSSVENFEFKKRINFLYSTMTHVEFEDFVFETYKKIDRICNLNKENVVSFWNEIAYSTNPWIRNVLIGLIKRERRAFAEFYNKYPAIINEVVRDKAFAKDYLFNYALKYEIRQLLDISIFYINGNLLINEEIQLLFREMVNSLNNSYLLYQLKEDESKRLVFINYNFMEHILSYLKRVDMKNFQAAFSNETKFLFYMKFGVIDEYIYELTVHYIKRLYTGSLLEEIIKLLSNDQQVIKKYKDFQNNSNKHDLDGYITP